MRRNNNPIVQEKNIPGAYGEVDMDRKIISINPNKNRSGIEYLDTVIHERLHLAHPSWTEAQVEEESRKQRLSTIAII